MKEEETQHLGMVVAAVGTTEAQVPP